GWHPEESESLSDRCEAHLSGCQSRPPPTAPHPGCPVDTGGRHAGERQMARSELASRDQGAGEGPLRRAPRPHRGRAAATNMGQGSATSSGRRSLAHRRTPDIGREEILPRQPPSWHGPARPGGHDQGARWVCEQAHQQLKEELGLDHFEGRSWAGLHRHALMTMIAYAFLQHRRLTSARRKKKSQRTTASTKLAGRAARHHLALHPIATTTMSSL